MVKAPKRPRYANSGGALAVLQSRQVELGVKLSRAHWSWGLAYFDIERPAFGDRPSATGGTAGCDSDAQPGSCIHRQDGVARHRGLESEAALRAGAWLWQAGVQWLHARRQGSANTAVNGQRPTNVPGATLKLHSRFDVAALPGFSIAAELLAEGDRMVLEDNSVRIPGYAKFGAQLRYAMHRGSTALVWRAGIDNLLDRRAWRESPPQFGHVYLFPLAPRSVSFSVEAAL